MPGHFHTIQKSVLLKTRESDFSLVWIMEFSIISPCLGEVKVFSDKSNLTDLVHVQRWHGYSK